MSDDDDAPHGRNDYATIRLKNRIENGWTAETYDEEKETTMCEVKQRENAEQGKDEIPDTLDYVYEQLKKFDCGGDPIEELVGRAVRAIAAKDAALMLFHEQAELDGFCWPKSKCMACNALSPGAGNGWLSPEKAEKLKVDLESWEQQASEHAKLAIQLGKERDAWREDAMRLAAALEIGDPDRQSEAVTAHDALVAKEGGK